MEMQTATSSASWQLQVQPRNSDGRERIGFLPQWSFGTLVTAGYAAGTCELNYRLGLTFDGNGQWRRISRTCCQGRWSCTMSTTQCSGGRLAMEPMEGATIPPKIYSKLWGKVVAIIKFLPPCKLWLKFHDFWNGLKFILLLVITFSSTQIDTPSQMP